MPFPITFKDIFFNSSNPFQFIFVLWIFSVLFFSNIHGLYHTRREQLESIEIWQVTKSVLYSSLLVIVAIYILKIDGFPRSILVLTTCFLNVFMSVWRFP